MRTRAWRRAAKTKKIRSRYRNVYFNYGRLDEMRNYVGFLYNEYAYEKAKTSFTYKKSRYDIKPSAYRRAKEKENANNTLKTEYEDFQWIR